MAIDAHGFWQDFRDRREERDERTGSADRLAKCQLLRWDCNYLQAHPCATWKALDCN